MVSIKNFKEAKEEGARIKKKNKGGKKQKIKILYEKNKIF